MLPIRFYLMQVKKCDKVPSGRGNACGGGGTLALGLSLHLINKAVMKQLTTFIKVSETKSSQCSTLGMTPTSGNAVMLDASPCAVGAADRSSAVG